MQRIVSSAQDRDSGTATQKPLPLSPSPNGDHTGSDYWQPIRRDGSPSGSASKASSSAFTTPQLETTQDHVRIPPNLPIHPEFQSFLTLDATHRSKVYLSNRLFMKTDGSTSRSQGWSDVWAQLMGNTLSLWRMNEIEAARKEGRSILPRTLSVTDAVVGLSKTTPGSVFELLMPDSTVLQFSCPDEQGFISWITAFRLACWEKTRLEELFTGCLLRTTFSEGQIWIEPSSLFNGGKEGPMTIYLPGRKDLVRGWGVLTSTMVPGSPTPSLESAPGSSKRHRRSMSSFLSRRRSSMPASPFLPAMLVVYASASPKDRKKPLATIYDITQAFIVYPENPDLIFRSTLLKLEGSVRSDDKALGCVSGREAWMAVIPESQQSKEKATLEEVLEWIIAFHDAFSLYGRPRSYVWDTRDPKSLMFANPRSQTAQDGFFLSKILAETIGIEEASTSHVRSRLRTLLMERINGGRASLSVPEQNQRLSVAARKPSKSPLGLPVPNNPPETQAEMRMSLPLPHAASNVSSNNHNARPMSVPSPVPMNRTSPLSGGSRESSASESPAKRPAESGQIYSSGPRKTLNLLIQATETPGRRGSTPESALSSNYASSAGHSTLILGPASPESTVTPVALPSISTLVPPRQERPPVKEELPREDGQSRLSNIVESNGESRHPVASNYRTTEHPNAPTSSSFHTSGTSLPRLLDRVGEQSKRVQNLEEDDDNDDVFMFSKKPIEQYSQLGSSNANHVPISRPQPDIPLISGVPPSQPSNPPAWQRVTTQAEANEAALISSPEEMSPRAGEVLRASPGSIELQLDAPKVSIPQQSQIPESLLMALEQPPQAAISPSPQYSMSSSFAGDATPPPIPPKPSPKTTLSYRPLPKEPIPTPPPSVDARPSAVRKPTKPLPRPPPRSLPIPQPPKAEKPPASMERPPSEPLVPEGRASSDAYVVQSKPYKPLPPIQIPGVGGFPQPPQHVWPMSTSPTPLPPPPLPPRTPTTRRHTQSFDIKRWKEPTDEDSSPNRKSPSHSPQGQALRKRQSANPLPPPMPLLYNQPTSPEASPSSPIPHRRQSDTTSLHSKKGRRSSFRFFGRGDKDHHSPPPVPVATSPTSPESRRSQEYFNFSGPTGPRRENTMSLALPTFEPLGSLMADSPWFINGNDSFDDVKPKRR